MRPAHHAMAEAKRKDHEGEPYSLLVRLVDGSTVEGSVIESDTDVLVLDTGISPVYISHAHIISAQIEWG